MPLINFKTNLTNLKYGADRPGGGDSGQPFVQFPIPGPTTPTNVLDYYIANRTSLDYPIRGGALVSAPNGALTTNAGVFDSALIQRFIASAPRGKAFVDKQKGLQLTNPLTQVPDTVNLSAVSFLNIGQAVLPVTQTYNPLNTIAQVGFMGTGVHFNRQGVDPTLFEDVQQTYQYIVGAPENNQTNTNRLSVLKSLKLLGSSNFITNANSIDALGIDTNLVDRLGISPIQGQLFNYQGGPGSVYGIGATIINKATDTDAANIPEVQSVNFTVSGVQQAYSAIGFTYNQIAQQNTRTSDTSTPLYYYLSNGSVVTNVNINTALSPVYAKIQDFRAQTNKGNPIIPYDKTNYKSTNIATAIGIGNPGAPLGSGASYTTSKPDGVDRVNLSKPFYFDPTTTDPWTGGGLQSQFTKDIIKFAFECLSNEIDPDIGQPLLSGALVFRAFLEGQIQDSNNASYNTFKYLGRGETFRTYQGFERSISFSFKIFAQSRRELEPLYSKLNHLISQVYPDYSQKYGLMRGNVVNLTIGDYIYRMPGFLDSVNVTIDNSNTPWEIVLNEQLETDVAQLPHMITVQCSFKPIMDILPRRETYNNPRVPLIVNDKGTRTSLLKTTKRSLAVSQAAPDTNIPIPVDTAQRIGAGLANALQVEPGIKPINPVIGNQNIYDYN